MIATESAIQTERFVACIFEPTDIVELRLIQRRKSVKRWWHTANELPSLAERLANDNADGWNVYAGMNPRRRRGGGKAADVALARCLVADFDGGAAPALARRQWESARLPEPTLVLHSGHGVHSYWRLTEPMACLAEWTAAQKALIAVLASDPKIADAPHVMRLPGFQNCKSEPRVPCRIIDADPARRYSQAELQVCRSVGLVETETYSCNLVDTANTANSADSANPTDPTSPESTAPAAPSMLHDPIELAIISTLPIRIAERRACLFELARRLKAVPALADARPVDLEQIVRRWHSAALPVIGTKPVDETLFDFAQAWNNVKYPAGHGPIEVVFAKAREAAAPSVAMRFEQEPLRVLIGACRELQRIAGAGVFFLDCRTAGKELQVDHTTAWRWLRGLCNYGILRLESVGSRETRRANCYRYLADI